MNAADYLERQLVLFTECECTRGGRQPRFFIWENVPGAFSSNKGLDFKSVLEEIGQTEIPMPANGKWAENGVAQLPGCEIAWRVLDAVAWVPQRRKRIFLVADFAASNRCAKEVLFVIESMPGDSEQGSEKRQTVTGDAEESIGDADAYGVVTKGNGDAFLNEKTHTALTNGGGQAGQGYPAVCVRMRAGKPGGGKGPLLSPNKSLTLAANANDQVVFERHRSSVTITEGTASPTLQAAMGMGGNNIPMIMDNTHKAYCIAGNTIDRQIQNGGNGKGVNEEVSFTLNTIDRHAVAYDTYQKTVGALCSCDAKQAGSQYVNQDKLICAVDVRNSKEGLINGTLQAGPELNNNTVVRTNYAVRRLTPRECERLQGLSDDYTFLPGEKTCSDSARYKALGNGMAQPCADFVLRRLVEEVEKEATWN